MDKIEKAYFEAKFKNDFKERTEFNVFEKGYNSRDKEIETFMKSYDKANIELLYDLSEAKAEIKRLRYPLEQLLYLESVGKMMFGTDTINMIKKALKEGE